MSVRQEALVMGMRALRLKSAPESPEHLVKFEFLRGGEVDLHASFYAVEGADLSEPNIAELHQLYLEHVLSVLRPKPLRTILLTMLDALGARFTQGQTVFSLANSRHVEATFADASALTRWSEMSATYRFVKLELVTLREHAATLKDLPDWQRFLNADTKGWGTYLRGQ